MQVRVKRLISKRSKWSYCQLWGALDFTEWYRKQLGCEKICPSGNKWEICCFGPTVVVEGSSLT